MGVSGSGKTTVGKLLAQQLNIPFYDADEFHPQSNIDKMTAGQPLDDSDRKPWLELLSQKIFTWDRKRGAVLACSALKESYRSILSSQLQLHWVFLEGSKELIKHRMKERAHFFPEQLLQSQFDTLEVPDYGIHADINQPPGTLVPYIIKQLKA